MPQTGQFKEVQSGQTVRITMRDATTLDATFRRFVGSENTIICTTPIGQDYDPDAPNALTTHYIDEYVNFLYPIPVGQVNSDVSVGIGDNVEIRYSTGGSGIQSGVVTAIDASNAVIELDIAGDAIVFKNFWYMRKL